MGGLLSLGNGLTQFVLVQAALLAADPPAQAPQQPAAAESLLSMLFPLIAIGFLFYFLLIRPQQRERQKADAMLKALKKNDRVVTIGGIIGSIVNIEPDSKVVTLKVDDNTRMMVLRSAIQGPWSDGKPESTAKDTAS